MPGTNEAVSPAWIDDQVADRGWDVLDPNAVRFEYVLPDSTRCDWYRDPQVRVDAENRARAPSARSEPQP